jgi:hypothetical protein
MQKVTDRQFQREIPLIDGDVLKINFGNKLLRPLTKCANFTVDKTNTVVQNSGITRRQTA